MRFDEALIVWFFSPIVVIFTHILPGVKTIISYNTTNNN